MYLKKTYNENKINKGFNVTDISKNFVQRIEK